MNEDAYAKMCDVLRIGKSKFAKYEYEKKPTTDKPKVTKPKVEKLRQLNLLGFLKSLNHLIQL